VATEPVARAGVVEPKQDNSSNSIPIVAVQGLVRGRGVAVVVVIV